MNAPVTASQGRALAPIKQFQQEVEQREAAFASSLPAHIPPERFKRVVLRAVQKTPDLLAADRASLLSAAMDAANDGLLPDGREGAMVIYNTKVRRNGKDEWIKKVQWMPMIFGILKKVRNSGELKALSVRVVFGGDQFRYWIDENGEHLNYEAADNPDKSIVRRIFAQALTKDGGVYIEVMDVEDIEKVRRASKSKDKGPWVDWWEEMAKKTVLRRLAKRLPMSTDLDDLMRRDDALYDFDSGKVRPNVEPPKMLNDRLDALADMRDAGDISDGSTDDVETDPETGEVIDHESEPSSPNGSDGSENPSPAADQSSPEGTSTSGDDDETSEETPEQTARRRGAEARAAGMSRKAVPPEYRKDERLQMAYLDGFDTGIADDTEPGAEG